MIDAPYSGVLVAWIRRGSGFHSPGCCLAGVPEQVLAVVATGQAREAARSPRGSQFTEQFDAVFETCGPQIVKGPPQAPRANAICERLIGSLRRELSGRILIISQAHLRTVLAGYALRCNTARPHQGIAQRVPDDYPS